MVKRTGWFSLHDLSLWTGVGLSDGQLGEDLVSIIDFQNVIVHKTSEKPLSFITFMCRDIIIALN